jgi:MoxR-like ATPase
MAEPSLAHRLILGPSARIRELDSRKLVDEILATTSAPGGEVSG